MAGIAVAGTRLFHGYASKPKPSVSTTAQLHKEFTPALPEFFSLNRQRLEVLPSKSLQTSLIRCYDTNKAASAKSEENATPNKGYFRSIIAEAAAGITPAVVHLYARQGQEVDGIIGSGAVIHKHGYILTCSHLFFDKTNMTHSSNVEVLVRLQKPKEDVVGQESEEDVVGHVVDAYVDLDIAIIKIDPPSSSLPTAKVGSSSKLRPGDWAIAMGSPLCLPNTVTLGIFSHVCRTSKDMNDGGMHKEYLQTDCAINPGNSGGPLCNVDGEVVGVSLETMNPQKASGVSFAVPVDFISAIIKPFQNFQSPQRPDFGWVVRNVSEENSEALEKHYPKFRYPDEGVFVQRVVKGSPAFRAGIQACDVVMEFNGKRVRDITEMMDAMGERSGKPVELLVKRARDGRDASVRLHHYFPGESCREIVGNRRPRL